MIDRLIERYKEERKTREIEKHLVEALYQASSVSAYTNFENVIKTLSESDYGLLSGEFGKAYNEINAGAGVEAALSRIIERNNSRILKRAVEILENGYRTGMDLSEALREVAEDAEKTMEIARENDASMVVEKYTILFAGGVIVPLILGAMVSLVSGLDFSPLSEFGVGSSQSGEILKNAVIGNQIYSIIYSIMASLFVAYQEKRLENSIVYMAVLLPLSLILFNLAARLL
jgi:flagellar protein FlaJ